MDKNKIKKIHLEVFSGKSDYIPLTVKVATQQLSDYTNWEGMMNPAKVVDTFWRYNKYTMQLESDWLPIIESNFLESLIPSMFGAEVYCSPGGLIDVKAFIKDIYETETMEVKDIYCGQMEQALKHLRYLKEHQIENVDVLMTRFGSPLDYAVMMRGGDFYLDMLVEPELSKNFMKKIGEATIEAVKVFKSELKEDLKSQITIRGFQFPGIRLTGDAVVNLSPDMIREYMFPVYDQFADEFGSVMLHYCTTPAPSGHVLPVLVDCPSILCVDNWQGYKTFFDKNETGMMQERVAVCTDVSPTDIENLEEFMENHPFYSKVKRKGGRGLTASVIVSSVDEGKRLYDHWRNYFEKN